MCPPLLTSKESNIMNKFYKSNCDSQIKVPLFGIGEVVIPANAKCIELAPGVADVINKMVYPTVVLEEVTPTFTVDNTPIVTKKKKPAKSVDEASEEEVFDKEPEPLDVETEAPKEDPPAENFEDLEV